MDKGFIISIHDNGSGERVTLTIESYPEIFITGKTAESLACDIFDTLDLFRARQKSLSTLSEPVIVDDAKSHCYCDTALEGDWPCKICMNKHKSNS